jgi:hypothetical protein
VDALPSPGSPQLALEPFVNIEDDGTDGAIAICLVHAENEILLVQMGIGPAVAWPAIIHSAAVVLQKGARQGSEFNSIPLPAVSLDKVGAELLDGPAEVSSESLDVGIGQQRLHNTATVTAVGTVNLCGNLLIQLHDHSVDPGDRQIGRLQITAETPVFVLSLPGQLHDFPDVCFHWHGSIIDE